MILKNFPKLLLLRERLVLLLHSIKMVTYGMMLVFTVKLVLNLLPVFLAVSSERDEAGRRCMETERQTFEIDVRLQS